MADEAHLHELMLVNIVKQLCSLIISTVHETTLWSRAGTHHSLLPEANSLDDEPFLRNFQELQEDSSCGIDIMLKPC